MIYTYLFFLGIVTLEQCYLLALYWGFLSPSFFLQAGGPDGGDATVYLFYYIIQISSIFWLIVLIAGSAMLAGRIIPLRCMYPTIAVLLIGLPFAWLNVQSMIATHEISASDAKERAIVDESIWTVLQLPEIKKEIEAARMRGEKFDTHTDSHGRVIEMPVRPDDPPYSVMIDETGRDGFFDVITVYHYSGTETPPLHSEYRVHRETHAVKLLFDKVRT